jgi:hypothetical protein
VREGAVEDWLHVVVDGELRWCATTARHDRAGGGRRASPCSTRCRSATVRAVTDALLFRLDKASFDRLWSLRPEIAAG